jgi:hypothetical protein
MRILLLLSLVAVLYLIWFYPFRRKLKVKCTDGSEIIITDSAIHFSEDGTLDLSLVKRISLEKVGNGLYEFKVDTGSSLVTAVVERKTASKVLKFLGDRLS